jgi:hypothetical protein
MRAFFPDPRRRAVMMTHAKRTFPLSKLAIWVSTKWRARRARRIEEETLLSLSALEPKLLNDIGLDIGNLSARLARANAAQLQDGEDD